MICKCRGQSHMQHVLGKPVAFTKSFRFATIFFSLFALVLALFKVIVRLPLI